MDRREVVKRSAVAGAAGALTLGPVSFADAAPGADGGSGATQTRKVRGRLPPGAPDYVYVPVEVPPGVREIAVAYSYDRPAVPEGTVGNACDIGIFDERGTAPGGAGFRGWSGGARTEFFLRADDATPGYLPGPVRPGRWHIALGPYTIAPQGLAYEITVTLRRGAPGRTPAPVYPPERARGRGRAWYRGDSHLHSVHSDGGRTPAEIAALAREAGLDFLNTSEHNTTSSHRAWAGLWGDDLLILTGDEVTTRNGHVVAMGTDPGTFIDWRYRARDNAFGRYARAIRRAGGLVIPAHPHAPCIGCGWKFGLADADAVEVWNGPHTPDDDIALAEWDNALVAHARGERDRWLPAVGHSDAHRDPDVVGLPQTVVLADDLSRRALQDGIRAGRVWIAESAAVGLAFSVSGPRGEHAGIGGRLALPRTAPVTARLEVSGAPGCTVTLHTDQGVLHTASLPPSGAGTVSWPTTPDRAAYIRAEIRHPATTPGLPGPPAALTNPVFLGRG
ncbi:CehA/McbA family metallohydrolase [Streptomyces pinistramenti]|uniref:CehA/McbA family metallohydrolase n=1 Tax=Streptomyces pinistramenti TaxID=2884812 RepID=UPI001D089760|nr:CehA/McbA family metallohydrolase [Streptomyces pinistramenti]MCB5911267.1 CehA/McbA family metallohydrolase [Streptomyces pinistramenti]